MEIRPRTEQIDDPFFQAVRRRHPEVDIVLLPPEAPAPGDASETVSPDGVVTALSRVVDEAVRLSSVLGPGADEPPDARLGYGDSPSSVRAVATWCAARGGGFEALVRLRLELERGGWQLRRRAGVGVERLTGVHEGLRVSLSYAEGSELLMLTVSSEPMEIGLERARELTGARVER